MTTRITLDEDSIGQALAARPPAPAAAVTGTVKTGGGTVWRVQVTPPTVHRLEAIHRLAAASGARVDFVASDQLSEQERAFFDDYVAYRLTVSPLHRWKRAAAEWAQAGREAYDAAVRLRPGLARTPVATPSKLDSVVVIGVYGGDHIGDAAILGGVLLELHQRRGVKRATVMSARPAHTRRLVQGLSLPVAVEVKPYRAGQVEQSLDAADALVLGGGPLFDAPRILARHLAAIEAARRRGLPFLVERIGMNDFKPGLSRWAAQRVLRAASRVSVRSAQSARHPLVAGLHPITEHDPAFDYLNAPRALDRLPRLDAETIDTLLAAPTNALLIGLNIRPTRDDWLRLPDFRQPIVDPAYMQMLCTGLARFAAECERPVRYVFFPMNALQLGMSDLSAAYELRDVLPMTVDLSIWEGEPSLDGVLHLLRRLDAVVAMRFHAAVFALSQSTPLIGVDYFSGRGGKLTQLFGDVGRVEDVTTVSRFTSDWLVDRLRAADL